MLDCCCRGYLRVAPFGYVFGNTRIFQGHEIQLLGDVKATHVILALPAQQWPSYEKQV
jgi:hypothetical protein